MLPTLAGGVRCSDAAHQAYRMFSVSFLAVLGKPGVWRWQMQRARIAATRL